MGRRKGELSPARIDREFPHQIIVPCSLLSGGHYHFVRYFCDGLSAAPRGHSVVKDDEWHQIFCFRDRADAELFRQRFGGGWFDPATRGRGKSWHVLRAKPGEGQKNGPAGGRRGR